MPLAAVAAPSAVAVRADDAEFDKDLSALLASYLSAIEQSRLVPFVSVKGFLLLYLKTVRWMFSLYLVPLAFVWDFVFRPLWNALSRKHLSAWRAAPVAWLLAPFRALHRGEISAVKFVTLRSVVRLLLYYRLARRLNLLILYLRHRRVERFVSAPAGVDDKWFDDRLSVLRDCRESFGSRLGFAAVASVAGLFGIAGAAFKLLAKIPESWKDNILAFWHKALADLVRLPDPQAPLTIEFLVPALLAYLAWIVSTNWIEVRASIAASDVRSRERALFAAIGIDEPRDIPIDLIGLFLMLLLGIACTAADPGAMPEPVEDALWASIYLIIPIYALVRRWFYRTDDAPSA